MSSKRSVASGTVSFGLVSIPVKFYLTAQAQSVAFCMVTPKGNRVKQRLVDAVTGDAVEYGECSKGYEVTKDDLVVFSPEELKALGETGENRIDIKEFVPVADLDPTHVEKSYHLDAGKGGDRAYRLLTAALEKQGRCGVAQWTSRGRQHLLVLAAQDGHLVAYQMYYADEVRSFELDCATYMPAPQELDMACRLVDSLASPSFDPTSYRDAYRDRVDAAVTAKRTGAPAPAASQPKAPVDDLFAALQASLGSAPAPASVEPPTKKAKGKKAAS